MPNRPNRPPAKPRGSPKASPGTADSAILEGSREFIWDIFAISTHLSEIRRVWASMLGVTGPQWLILMTIDYLNKGEGVSVGTVSNKLHVAQTFVVSQSKKLEREGYLTRVGSEHDARVVLLSLTETTRRKLASVAPRRKEVNDFIFGDIDQSTMDGLCHTMSLIRARIDSALMMLRLPS